MSYKNLQKILLMKQLRLSLLSVCIMLLSFAANATDYTYHVSLDDIHMGYISKKIWLHNYANPEIKISDLQYTAGASLPEKVAPATADKYKTIMGKELKRPFVVISIPVYTQEGNDVKQLTDFTLTVNETVAAPTTAKRETKTTGTPSVLASGTWYKFSVPATGLYKVDFDFLKKLGIDVSNLSSANIRVFGNGGAMLSEDNRVPRANDLLENAIMVNDGGDGVFGQNDFFIFYAAGPTAWIKDSLNQRFIHNNNLYSDSSYYFITVDQGAGMRVANQAAVAAANETVNSFNDYAVHDVDLNNPGKLGKEWYGEQFNAGTTQNFSFNFGTTVTDVYSSIRVASVSTSSANNIFTIALNNQGLAGATLGKVQSSAEEYDPIIESYPLNNTTTINSTTATFTLTYQSAAADALGYLNYIELNMRRPLAFGASDKQFNFRDWASAGPGKVASYVIGNTNSATQVWDVTNPQVPVKMNGSTGGNSFSFTQDAQMLHEFVTANTTDLPVPAAIGKIDNQNLHGMDQVNMIIVVNPAYLDQANQLAAIHRNSDNLSVAVVTTAQVYNEFSSGAQDISAIRDFTRMFYDRAGNDSTQMPHYLLLFGGASYDYKDRVPNNSNFVPAYETSQSHDNVNGFCTDDFYGMLDDNEFIDDPNVYNTMDVSVGRIPARNQDDANAAVDKITAYKSTASLGPWRISSMFVGDKEDGAGYHLRDANNMANTLTDNTSNLYNHTKVFVDNIPLINTPAGDRCPNANAAINDQVFKGTFIIDYCGHGNTTLWSYERILTQDDYNSWANIHSLPLLVTATCDFGQFDQPSAASAGERVVVRPGGGVIAAVTTTQAVFAGANGLINKAYISEQFSKNANGKWNAVGDALRLAKNSEYAAVNYNTDPGDILNFRKFSLLGDPAIVPNFPQYAMRLDSVVDEAAAMLTDSIKALGKYTIYGSITDGSNNVLSGFNGTTYLALYDKAKTVNVSTYYGIETFTTQTNSVYKGKVSISNGAFSCTFIAPKDINYNYGKGKLSLYANSATTDGAGTDSSITVGGFSDNPVISTVAPIVKAYIGDSLFLDGGITGPNTSLYAVLYDETGINVSGNDIGHDLTAVLDDSVTAPYILNDYYETAPNTYQKGFVKFPLSGLSEGRHKLTVRAWDVNDNYGEGTVNFVVVNGNVFKVNNLMNYPNPFRDITHFVFDHNHPDEELRAEINIYSMAGKLVCTLKDTFTPSGSHTNEMTWNGTDASGTKLPPGMYVYTLKIATDSGIEAVAHQKLVLLSL